MEDTEALEEMEQIEQTDFDSEDLWEEQENNGEEQPVTESEIQEEVMDAPEPLTPPPNPYELAQRQAQAEKDRFYASQGIMNPYTNQPVRTEADYQAYVTQWQKEQREEQLRQAGIDPNLIQQAVYENPIVQKAQQVIKQTEAQQTQAFISNELSNLQAQFPDCKVRSVEELAALPEGQKVLDYWTKGIALADAYALCNIKQITEKKTAAAKQAALNKINGTAHLTQSKGSPGEDVIVPAETMEQYRQWFPSWTDKQIIADYKKNM